MKPDTPWYLPPERIATQSPSRLQLYQECPRMYFYKQLLGWGMEDTSHHLVIGTAWHLAKEYLRLNGHTTQDVSNAFELYMEHYRSEFEPEQDSSVGSKTPMVINEALTTYAQIYSYNEYKTLETEIEFTVLLGEGRSITGRIDAIIEDERGKLWIVDDKTTTKESYCWEFEYYLKGQTCAYLFAVQSLFGFDKVGGLIVEKAFLRTNGPSVKRAIVTKSRPEMHDWYLNTMRWYDFIDDDITAVDNEADLPVMSSFIKRTETCTYYYGGICQYHPLCCAWPNPLVRCKEAPFEYKCNKTFKVDRKPAKKVYNDVEGLSLEDL